MAQKPSNKKDESRKQQTANVPAQQEGGGALILMHDTPPAHIQTGQGRGSENVQTDDLVIPRLEIVQAMSPCLDPNNEAEYIKGAKIGDLINSVTNQNYGREVFVVNVHYTKQWLVWKDRKQGGGFFGAYPNPEEAADRVEQEGGKNAGIEAIDTPTHLCLIVDRENGRVDEILVSMPRTKAKVSRAWNSMIRLAGGDRFGRVYRLTTAQEKNKRNEAYQNFVVAQSGYPAKPLFDKAEKLWQSVSSGGRTIKMDTKGYDPAADGDGDTSSAEM